MNTVSRWLPIHHHPFRLLLYLEWLLLGITFFGELPLSGIPELGLGTATVTSSSGIPFTGLLMVLCMVGFGVMGLRLPQDTTPAKWLYTALQFGLLWVITALGSGHVLVLSPYLIIVIRSCLIFQPRQRILATVLVFLSFLTSLVIAVRDVQTIQSELTQTRSITLDQVQLMMISLVINNALLFSLVLVFVLMLVNALLNERQSRQKLAIAHEQLRQYALRIEDQAALQERNRIAREIHDALGHTLTAQTIQLENALLFCQSNTEKAQTFLSEAQQLAKLALKEIRQSVSTLRSDPLQGKSLETALAGLIEDFCKRTGVNPICTLAIAAPITSDVQTTVYRIIQEALTNICKHSDATQVTLNLQTTPQALRLVIEDNGNGFHPEKNTTGFGLQGMRERTLALGGQLELTSAIAQGCRILVEIPLVKWLP